MDRFCPEERKEIVLHALKGAHPDRLSHDHNVPVDKIAYWIHVFVDGGLKALSEAAFREVVNDLILALVYG